MFAVIKTGGKQYRVAEDQVLRVERVAGEAGDIVEFADVLMVSGEKGSTIGSPKVEGALVTAEILEQMRDRKVLSFKKRRRQNSKRIRGHRQMLTSVRIAEILTGGAKPKKAAARKPARAETAAKAEAPAKAPAKAEAKAETKAETKAEAKPAKPAAKTAKPAAAEKPAKAAAKPAAKKPAAKKPAAKKPAKDSE